MFETETNAFSLPPNPKATHYTASQQNTQNHLAGKLRSKSHIRNDINGIVEPNATMNNINYARSSQKKTVLSTHYSPCPKIPSAMIDI